MSRTTIYLAVVAIVFPLIGGSANAQISSTRILAPGANNWFNAAAWNNGVPQLPGDHANLQQPGGTASQLQLGSPASLERLIVTGHGSLNITGTGPLAFRNDGVGPLEFELSPAGGDLDAIVSTFVSLSDSLPLQVTVPAESSLQWNGNFISEAGDFVKQGAGTMRLTSNNDRWEGELIVNDGTVVVTTATALGSVTNGASVNAGAVLAFEQSSAEPIHVDGGAVHVRNLQLSGPMSLTGSAVVFRPQNPLVPDRGGFREISTGPTGLFGHISGAGSLTIENRSRDSVTISSDNTYTGHTFVIAGQVWATSSSSLGSSAEGTTIRGGTLNVQVPTNERFRVEGGQLRFGSGSSAPTDPIVIAGGDVFFPAQAVIPTPIVVDGMGGGIHRGVNPDSWIGGSTGTGSLRLGSGINVDAPLAHLGDLYIAGASLNVANSYTGDTYVTGEAKINHAGAFGASDNIYIQNGYLQLNVRPTGNPHYFVNGGTLRFSDSPQPVANAITIDGSGYSYLEGNVTYTGTIDIDGDNYLGIRFLQGTFNGTIRGDGFLVLGGGTGHTIRLNAANDITGPVLVSAGIVEVNHSDALNLEGTFVVGGHAHLNAPTRGSPVITRQVDRTGTVVFNAPQNYSEPWAVNEGTLEIAADVTMPQLILFGGSNDLASVRGTGGNLEIDDEIRVMHAGAIDGAVVGDGNIRLVGSTLYVAGDLSDFTGDFHAHSGRLDLGYSAPGFGSPLLLNPESDIHVYDDSSLRLFNFDASEVKIIENDIFVHQAQGSNSRQGAIIREGNGNHILRGRLHVGEQGSTIEGAFRIEGQIIGTNLTIAYGGQSIASPQRQLRGEVRISDESALSIDEGGDLHGVNTIRIEGGSLNITSPNLANPDRVDDRTRIESHGGFIRLFHHLHTTGPETLGPLHLRGGLTNVLARDTDPLFFERLERDPGALLRISLHSRPNGVRFVNPPSMQYGMIGAWATTDDGFAKVSTNGKIETVATTSNDLNAAGPQDHVGLSDNHTLMSDKTIASLQHGQNGTLRTLDLNGHTLTILSGGVFRSEKILNGRLTAGDGGDAELVLHQAYEVSSDIVDNAGGGSVALVVNSTTSLAGNNSYTGGTWVVGSDRYSSSNPRLLIKERSAIPSNDRVYVDGATYEVQVPTDGEVSLAELHLQNGGYVTANTPLNVQQMVLEDGELGAFLTGNGSIVKSTDGTVSLPNATSSDFSGTVTVRDGLLALAHRALSNAALVVEGGQLEMTGDFGSQNNLVLKGGTIGAGFFNGSLDIQSDSQLSHLGTTTFAGNITGSGDLTIRGNQDDPFNRYVAFFGNASGYSGDIHVESGAFRVGSPGNAGTGVITVEEAGRLILGSRNDSDPPTSIGNEIHLRGGTLYSSPPGNIFTSNSLAPSRTTGTVFVHDAAFIGASTNGIQGTQQLPGFTIAGQLILLNGSRVYGLTNSRHDIWLGRVPLVEISGELRVGADTTWHLLTSSLSISGVIRPHEMYGSINFVGNRELLVLEDTDIQVDAGQSLAVRINGEELPVEIRGANGSLRGRGMLTGNFAVSDGASISPGASAGVLSVDGDVTLGPGGRLAIEIAGTQRDTQYDALIVDDNVILDGALLDVSLLNNFMPAIDHFFDILDFASLSGEFSQLNLPALASGLKWDTSNLYEHGILKIAAGIQGDYNQNGLVDTADYVVWRNNLGTIYTQNDYNLWRAQFGQTAGSGAIHLASVPEPATLALLLIALAAHSVRRPPNPISRGEFECGDIPSGRGRLQLRSARCRGA